MAVLARELVGVVVAVDQRLPAPGWWPCWLHAEEGSGPQVVTTTATDVCIKIETLVRLNLLAMFHDVCGKKSR